ncbi:M48 family metallopeptidase [Polaromonas sp. A23]|uniref:tetratricopeptide repeat protein n=1 Tax=Polaromonas sp. A23 TaxID=1944133 RepID=UPI0009840A76|nr:hypothetical protein [Polaromonas sp. A23]OOG43042.1 hypothetical protein B0B52_10395 [Polaromonas sp. A23]
MKFFKSVPRSIAVFAVILLGGWLPLSAAAAAKPESKTVAQARELIDADYGNGNVAKAIPLIEAAYKTDPDDANLLIQAARVAVKNGVLSFSPHRDSWASYAALLDKALAIDAAHPKIHILRAQVFERQGNFAEQLNELNKAFDLKTTDPWLFVGYGNHFLNVRKFNEAVAHYENVEARGPGTMASERRAFIMAISELASLASQNEDPAVKLRKYAALALKTKDPADGWTPQRYAAAFIPQHLFDEAIFYAREALKAMNFGMARITLAVALYGKAAQLTLADRPMQEVKPFLDEAKKLGYKKADIYGYLSSCSPCRARFATIGPTLDKIIPE